jgi:hypothetical protein
VAGKIDRGGGGGGGKSYYLRSTGSVGISQSGKEISRGEETECDDQREEDNDENDVCPQ